MSGLVSFGLGCFNISIEAQDEEVISREEYIHRVSSVLNGIPGVTEVECYYDEDEDGTVDLDKPVSIESSPGDWFYAIEFCLLVPENIQRKILGNAHDSSVETYGKMKIVIRYEYYLPVAIVSLDGYVYCPNPWPLVRLARCYLEQEFKDGSVKFNFLGPSPFHAEFFLEKSFDGNGEHYCKNIKIVDEDADNLDKLIFINTEQNLNNDDAFLQLSIPLAREASLFYYLIRMKNELWTTWREIESKINETIFSSSRSLFNKMMHFPSEQRKITDLMIRLKKFESNFSDYVNMKR